MLTSERLRASQTSERERRKAVWSSLVRFEAAWWSVLEQPGAAWWSLELPGGAFSKAACGPFWSSLVLLGEPISAGGPFKEKMANFEIGYPPKKDDKLNP